MKPDDTFEHTIVLILWVALFGVPLLVAWLY